jgi:hypothetical protein
MIFAFHKLVISQRRWEKGAKPPRDIRQALEVFAMLFRMEEGKGGTRN